MIVSTKGRNALKLMMCLAQVDDQAYTPLKVISAQQNISLKYLENLSLIHISCIKTTEKPLLAYTLDRLCGESCNSGGT